MDSATEILPEILPVRQLITFVRYVLPTPRTTLATAFQNETFLKAYHEFEIAGM